MVIFHSYVSLPEGNYIDYIHKHTHTDRKQGLSENRVPPNGHRFSVNPEREMLWFGGGASHGQWFFWDKFYQLLENIDVSPLRIMSFDVLCLYSKGASQLFWGPFGHFWMQPSGHKTRMRWIHNWQIWLFNLKNVHTFCGSIGTSFGAILNI